jgi:hypothetical protein
MSGIISDNLGRSSGLLKAAGGGGIVVQKVFVESTTKATSTVVWPSGRPWDNTIPQIDEGVETMTLAITPTNASNKLHIEARQICSNSTATENQAMMLFQDTTANALAGTSQQQQGAVRDNGCGLILNHYMTAGTTSETTFRIRIGNGSYTHNHTGGTMTFNGVADSVSTMLGGVMTSQIMITEYAV